MLVSVRLNVNPLTIPDSVGLVCLCLSICLSLFLLLFPLCLFCFILFISIFARRGLLLLFLLLFAHFICNSLIYETAKKTKKSKTIWLIEKRQVSEIYRQKWTKSEREKEKKRERNWQSDLCISAFLLLPNRCTLFLSSLSFPTSVRARICLHFLLLAIIPNLRFLECPVAALPRHRSQAPRTATATPASPQLSAALSTDPQLPTILHTAPRTERMDMRSANSRYVLGKKWTIKKNTCQPLEERSRWIPGRRGWAGRGVGKRWVGRGGEANAKKQI